jgi:hypothetical protein
MSIIYTHWENDRISCILKWALFIAATLFPVMSRLLFRVSVCMAARFIWTDRARVPHTERVSGYDSLIGSSLRGITFHLEVAEIRDVTSYSREITQRRLTYIV